MLIISFKIIINFIIINILGLWKLCNLNVINFFFPVILVVSFDIFILILSICISLLFFLFWHFISKWISVTHFLLVSFFILLYITIQSCKLVLIVLYFLVNLLNQHFFSFIFIILGLLLFRLFNILIIIFFYFFQHILDYFGIIFGFFGFSSWFFCGSCWRLFLFYLPFATFG